MSYLETRDELYVAIGCPNNRTFERIMHTLKLERHLADPRFASYASRKINENAICALVKTAVRELACAGTGDAIGRSWSSLFDRQKL